MRPTSESKPTFLVLAIIAASIVSAAAAPPGHTPGRGRPGQPGGPPPQTPASVQPEDVAPMDSHLSAYRLDRLIVVVARGKNRTGGYTTRLESGKPDADPPEVHLRNIPPPRGAPAPQAVTPFDVAAYFTPAAPDAEQLTIMIAGRPTKLDIQPLEEMKRSQEFGERPSPPAPGPGRRP